MRRDVIKSYAQPAPRYTSYPPATYFRHDVDAATYRAWLTELPAETTLSLYVHIPYCEQLCWYCGCTTRGVSRYEPVARYSAILVREIAMVAETLGRQQRVTHVHWGGGSPNILSAPDIEAMADRLVSQFDIAKDAEFAVEVDPRRLTVDRVSAFVKAGVTRVSLGVQDFDPQVQAAINRHQSFEMTRQAVDWFRAAGTKSINIDLVYGLPHQTRKSVARTLEQVLQLQPDRVAAFGYAHLPERLRNQRLIDSAALPDAVERFAQSQRIRRTLTAAGYVPIGIDHFARAGDSLAIKPVKRNFQGYTSDDAQALIGFGTSSIGRLPRGYVQNASATPEYLSLIESGGLATVRGMKLTDDDRLRAFIIENLMCDFKFSRSELQERFGRAAGRILEEAEAIAASDREGFFVRSDDGYAVAPRGQPFVRLICACFDSYAQAGIQGLHTQGV